eukprot:2018510-Pleurochrysis_carterae.AAC.3
MMYAQNGRIIGHTFLIADEYMQQQKLYDTGIHEVEAALRKYEWGAGLNRSIRSGIFDCARHRRSDLCTRRVVMLQMKSPTVVIECRGTQSQYIQSGDVCIELACSSQLPMPMQGMAICMV